MLTTATRLVLWNSGSRRAEEAVALRDELEADDGFHLIETRGRGEAQALARQAVADGLEMVVAAGGDGTVSSLAEALHGQSRTSLAVLPLGTGNDFCRNMDLPLEFDAARALLDSPRRRKIDLVHLTAGSEERWFVNVASGGNSVRVTEMLTDELKSTWGTWVFVRGALGVLTDLKSYETIIQLDDRPPERHTLWNFLVANGKYSAGGLPVAPSAIPDDGMVDIVMIEPGTAGDVVSIAADLISGDYLDHETVNSLRASKVKIEVEPATRVVADGEIIEADTITFQVEPGALSIVVPDPDAPDRDASW